MFGPGLGLTHTREELVKVGACLVATVTLLIFWVSRS